MKYKIGDIYKSNNYGKYKLINRQRKHWNNNKYKKTKYKIEFIKSGYTKWVGTSEIKSGKIMDRSQLININDVYISNNYGKFKIIDIKRKKWANKNYHKTKYLCEFINTRYQTWEEQSKIRSGHIKDRTAKTIHGVGSIGSINISENKREYSVWTSMLGRCYNKNSKTYKSYGLKGIRVSDSWLVFDNFLKDIKSLIGWDKNKFNEGKLTLDKDFLQPNIDKKIYSKDTCCWIPREFNDILHSKDKINFFKAISPENKIYYHYNQRKFARKCGLRQSSISAVLNETTNQHNGWEFQFVNRNEFLSNYKGNLPNTLFEIWGELENEIS